MRKLLASLLLFLTLSAAHGQCIGSLPVNLTNGTTADASQVMADFNFILSQTNANCATAGANSNITSLSGLITPITSGQGGSQYYSGGTSTGSANAQVVATLTPAGYSNIQGRVVSFIPGFTNTANSTLQFNGQTAANVVKIVNGVFVGLAGNEIVTGKIAYTIYDGTQFILLNPQSTIPGTNVLGISGNTTISSSNNGSLLVINSTNPTITLAATSAGTYFTFTLGSQTTFTLSASSGVFLGPNGNGTSTQAITGLSLKNVIVFFDGTNYNLVFYAVHPSASITVQRLLSGSSATYTTPANVTRVHVRMCAGGGGGGASNTNAGTGGGATSFGSWTTGGGGGGAPAGGAGGSGGSGGSDGSGALVIRMRGNSGATSVPDTAGSTVGVGGSGGGGPWGGSAIGSNSATGGTSAVANSCAGGGGANAGGGVGGQNGGGGGAGEYVEFWMTGAQVGATQTFTVGGSGAGGVAGGQAGGAGGSGIIVVEEFYF